MAQRNYLQALDFAHQFGFQSFEALNIHFIHQQGKLLQLNQKYGIFTFSPEELERLGLEGNVMYLPELDLVDETNKDCKARLSNCRIGAGALYFGGAAACLAGGAIVTGGSGGLGAPAGTYIAYVCLAANAAYYYSNLNQCNYDYEDCTSE